MVAAMQLTGQVALRQACLAAFAAKNRTVNKGGVSPMQAVTGRSATIPGSLIQQICAGQMRYQYNQAMETTRLCSGPIAYGKGLLSPITGWIRKV